MGPVRRAFRLRRGEREADAHRDLIFRALPSPSSSSPDSVAANRGAAGGLSLGVCVLIDIARFRFGFRGDLRVYSIGSRGSGRWRAESEISQDPRSLPLLRAVFHWCASWWRMRSAWCLRWRTAISPRNRAARNHTDSSAGHSAIHSRASFLPGVNAGHGGAVSQRQLGVELGSIILIFHRAGLEHRLQLLFLAEDDSARFAGSRDYYRFSAWQRFLELDLPFSTIGWCEFDDVRGGWMVLPDGVRNVRAG